MAIRVLIVEDNPQFRAAIEALVDHAPDMTTVGTFGTAEAALAALPGLEPDAVLMDIELPGIGGIDAVRRVKAIRPSAQVVMLTAFESPERVFDSLRAGATGYVLKRAPSAHILDAIRDVCAGGAPMSGAVARLVVEHFNQPPRTPEVDALTDRERAVLVALSEGQQYKEIAAALDISINTVRTHIRSSYEKLQVTSRLEAIRKIGRL